MAPEGFLSDLLESVCVLQREGLSLTFSHRSFQEYFCAYSLLRLPQEQSKVLARQFASRTRDSVFNLLNEMNRSLFEDIYVEPMII
jgi:hypothetical protein